MSEVKIDLEGMRARSQGVIDRGEEVRAILREGGYKEVPQTPMGVLAADVLALCAEVERLRAGIGEMLAVREIRCECGNVRVYQRRDVRLVGLPNNWCKDCFEKACPAFGCHPSRIAERSDYQPDDAVIARRLLEPA